MLHYAPYRRAGINIKMLLDEKQVNNRLSSPDNLINRMKALRERGQNSVAIIPARSNDDAAILSIPPSVDDLIDNVENKLAYGRIHKSALGLIENSMKELHLRLPEVSKPESFATIAKDMNAIVKSIREDRKNQSGNSVMIQIYAPQFRTEQEYETVNVSE